jgi:23S rRNA (guanosine2251-2'-O)-methyltransferase
MAEENSQNHDLVFGVHPVLEALNSGSQVDKVFLSRTTKDPLISEIITVCKSLLVPYIYVPVEKLNRLTRKNHQGIVAFVSPVSYYQIESLIPTIFEHGEDPFILILDRITDVRNFGAIARSAEAAGVHTIVIPARGSVSVGSDALKTSAGALMRVKVCREFNLKSSLDYLKMSGVRLIAVTEKSGNSIYEEDLSGPLALIMGSEEDGISGEYLRKADQRLAIPMQGTLSSLNVGVAAGVAMFEVVRQRNKKA